MTEPIDLDRLVKAIDNNSLVVKRGISTHWDDCCYSHWGCATLRVVAELRAARSTIASLRSDIEAKATVLASDGRTIASLRALLAWSSAQIASLDGPAHKPSCHIGSDHDCDCGADQLAADVEREARQP